jgi:hypothetical protein
MFQKEHPSRIPEAAPGDEEKLRLHQPQGFYSFQDSMGQRLLRRNALVGMRQACASNPSIVTPFRPALRQSEDRMGQRLPRRNVLIGMRQRYASDPSIFTPFRPARQEKKANSGFPCNPSLH